MAKENRKSPPEKAKHTWSGSQGAWANAWCQTSGNDAKDPKSASTVDKTEDSDEVSGDNPSKSST